MNCRINTSLRLFGTPQRKNSDVTRENGIIRPVGKIPPWCETPVERSAFATNIGLSPWPAARRWLLHGSQHTGRSSVAHGRTQTFFGVTIPISAIELEEYGRVGNGHIGFNYHGAERFGSAVEPGDNFFVRKSTYARTRKGYIDPFTIELHAGRILVIDKGQF